MGLKQLFRQRSSTSSAISHSDSLRSHTGNSSINSAPEDSERGNQSFGKAKTFNHSGGKENSRDSMSKSIKDAVDRSIRNDNPDDPNFYKIFVNAHVKATLHQTEAEFFSLKKPSPRSLNSYIYGFELVYGIFRWEIFKTTANFEDLVYRIEEWATPKGVNTPSGINFKTEAEDPLGFHSMLTSYLNTVSTKFELSNSKVYKEFCQVSAASFLNMGEEKPYEGPLKVKPLDVKKETFLWFRCSYARSKKRWVILQPDYIAWSTDSTQEPFQFFSFDTAFEMRDRRSDTDYKYGILLTNNSRKLVLKAKDRVQKRMWVQNIRDAFERSQWNPRNPHRYESLYPMRMSGINCTSFVDGQQYYHDLFRHLEAAREEVLLTDWWLSPDMYLVRPVGLPSGRNSQTQVVEALGRLADRGISIYVFMYREFEGALYQESFYVIKRLRRRNPNIHILSHPSQAIPRLWSHHDKIVVIDRKVGYIGGLDLCFGRYDTNAHPLTDLPNDREEVMWPGIDYYNVRIREFEKVSKPARDLIDRTCDHRMPWHDIHMKVEGIVAADIARHFMILYNHALNDLNDIKAKKSTNFRVLNFNRTVSPTRHRGRKRAMVKKFFRAITGKPQRDATSFDSGETPSQYQESSSSLQHPLIIPEVSEESERASLDSRRATLLHKDDEIDHYNETNDYLRMVDDESDDERDDAELEETKTEESADDQRATREGILVEEVKMSSLDKENDFSSSKPKARAKLLRATKSKSLVTSGSSQDNEGLSRMQKANTIQNDFAYEERHRSLLESISREIDTDNDLLTVDQSREEEIDEDIENRSSGMRRMGTKLYNWMRGEEDQELTRQEKEKQKDRLLKHFARERKLTIDISKEIGNTTFREEEDDSLTDEQGCCCQLVVSGSTWSCGFRKEISQSSIHIAYLELIHKAKRFIYIENQFFISSTAGKPVKNKVAEALALRILKAYHEREPFTVIVVLPLLPGFSGDIGSSGAAVLRYQLYWEYKTISGLFSKLTQEGMPRSKISQYINFYGLRQHGHLDDRYVTEMIYVHSKLMIVDDRISIMGSANINDRSLNGGRDSEVCMIVEDNQRVANAEMGGKPWDARGFAHDLRCRIFAEHLALSTEEVWDPVSAPFDRKIRKTTETNTLAYKRVFRCYPDDEIETLSQIKGFQLGSLINRQDQMDSEIRAELSQIRGHLVEFPLRFLRQENLTLKATNVENYLPVKGFV